MIDDTKARAAEVMAAWLANPNTRSAPDEIAPLLASIHTALGALGEAPAPAYKRAISPAASLRIVGRIISMIDGRPYTTLTRHLKAHGLTAAEYRERYGLKPDYPIVAPAYSEVRRAIAKTLWADRKRQDESAAS